MILSIINTEEKANSSNSDDAASAHAACAMLAHAADTVNGTEDGHDRHGVAESSGASHDERTSA